LAKLNTANIPVRVGIEYGYMDNNWNWIPFNSQKKKGTEMLVSKELRETLITSAQKDYANKVNAYNAAYSSMNEAKRVLEWAKSLTIGNGLILPTESNVKLSESPIQARYYVASKSGLTRGHYIYRYSDGSVDCTCPGFVNRGYCWASTKIKSNGLAFPKWYTSSSVFDANRKIALNAL
jgi:hypothetical protein